MDDIRSSNTDEYCPLDGPFFAVKGATGWQVFGQEMNNNGESYYSIHHDLNVSYSGIVDIVDRLNRIVQEWIKKDISKFAKKYYG